MSQDRNEELTALDRELAQMAQDVPEMPDDFHARWTEKIHEQAGETKTPSRQEGRRQWRYILSAAAVFVFLIGGTLLTRGAGKTKQQDAPILNSTLQIREDAVSGGDTGAAVYGDVPEEAFYEEAEEDADQAVNSAMEDTAAEAEEPDFAMEAVGAAENAYFAMEAAGTMQYDKAAAASEPAEEAAAEAPEAYAPAAPLMAEPAPEEERAAEKKAAGSGAENSLQADQQEERGEAQEENGFVAFLKDLGIFTLKTLIVVLGCAALAWMAALIHRAVKNRKK